MQLQEIFTKVQETKKQQRDLKRDYRDSLASSPSHQQVVEEMKVLKEKKKGIEEEIKKDFPQLERLKIDIESDMEMISDLALNSLVKGEAIKITDQYENEYEPILNVRFKKIG